MLHHRLTEQTRKVWILSSRLIMQTGIEREREPAMEEHFCLLSTWIFQAHGPPETVMFTCIRIRCSKGKWLSTSPWHLQERWERKIKEHEHRVSLRRGENTSYMRDQIRSGQRYNERDIALHETWELAKLMSSIYSSPAPELLPPLYMHTHANI